MRFKVKLKSYLFKGVAKIFNGYCNRFLYNNNSKEVGNVIKDLAYGEHSKQKLDVIIPKGKGPFSVIVYIHGGGWTVGDKKSYDRIVREYANSGYLVFNINYRLAPKFNYPSQIQDISKAIYFAYKKASEYNGDSSEMFLAGDSAGAHLSSWYAAALNKKILFKAIDIKNIIPKDALRGLLLFYGAYNVNEKNDFKVLWFSVDDMIESFLGDRIDVCKEKSLNISVNKHITRDYPPVFISSAIKDKLHSQSVKFEKILKLNNIYHKTFFISEDIDPKADHSFLNFNKLPSSKLAIEKSKEFLNEIKLLSSS
ncbi:MAG: alpha/beta hydrolase [Firmicutes bacterium]|nr:alpha/beta hydrolase [Bacillota bacterium]